MTPLDKGVVIVAVALHHALGGDAALLDEIAQALLHLGDGGRARQVGVREVLRSHHKVAVRVDETRGDGLAAHVNLLGTGVPGASAVEVAGEGDGAFVIDHERLKVGVLVGHRHKIGVEQKFHASSFLPRRLAGMLAMVPDARDGGHTGDGSDTRDGGRAGDGA